MSAHARLLFLLAALLLIAAYSLGSRRGNSAPLEEGPNGNVSDAEVFGYSPEARSASAHFYGGVKAPGERHVVSAVLRGRDNIKVRQGVVQAIPVDVVNVLMGLEATTEMLLHDPSVFFHLAAKKFELPISVAVDVSGPALRKSARWTARWRAEQLGSLAGMALEYRSALGTGECQHRIAPESVSVSGGGWVTKPARRHHSMKEAA